MRNNLQDSRRAQLKSHILTHNIPYRATVQFLTSSQLTALANSVQDTRDQHIVSRYHTPLKWHGWYLTQVCSIQTKIQLTPLNFLVENSYLLYIKLETNSCPVMRNNRASRFQSKKEDKYQESIHSSTTPDPGYQWESNKLTIRLHKREPRGQPFPSTWPQGINIQTRTKAYNKHKTEITWMIHKSTALEWSVKYFTGWLKPVPWHRSKSRLCRANFFS